MAIYDKLIIERSFGGMEGTPLEEYRKARERSGIPKHLYRPPGGGENYVDVKKRVKKFLSMVKKKHTKQTVLVVSHAAIIMILITMLMNKPLHSVYEITQHNTAVNIIELQRGLPPKVHYLNSTEHL